MGRGGKDEDSDAEAGVDNDDGERNIEGAMEDDDEGCCGSVDVDETVKEDGKEAAAVDVRMVVVHEEFTEVVSFMFC